MGFKVFPGLGFRVQGLGFGVWGRRIQERTQTHKTTKKSKRAQLSVRVGEAGRGGGGGGVPVRVLGSGLRVQGFGFRA